MQNKIDYGKMRKLQAATGEAHPGNGEIIGFEFSQNKQADTGRYPPFCIILRETFNPPV